MPRYAKRHYEDVARILCAEYPVEDHEDGAIMYHHECLVAQFTELFGLDNSRFDTLRFVAACKPHNET